MARLNSNYLRGVLELLILSALEAGTKHGYGVMEWIHQALHNDALVEEGTLYPALHRLEDKGLIQSDWGTSENNRRAKFYRITARGRKTLSRDGRIWTAFAQRASEVIEVPAKTIELPAD